jgi:hypothetical protein
MAGTFRVIEGGGQPEPDARIVDCLRALLARAEAGELYGVLVVADTLDGEPEAACAGPDTFRTLVLTDMMLPDIKAAALGYE